MIAARVFYERLITPLRALARQHGYALAVHGSLARDIDLIAVPWQEPSSEAATLVEAIRAEMEDVTGRRCFWLNDPSAARRDYLRRNPEPKWHGRLGWSIHIGGSGTYVDLSVMPRGGRFIDTYPQYEEVASV